MVRSAFIFVKLYFLLLLTGSSTEAEKQAEVSRILMEKQIMEKESQKKMRQLEGIFFLFFLFGSYLVNNNSSFSTAKMRLFSSMRKLLSMPNSTRTRKWPSPIEYFFFLSRFASLLFFSSDDSQIVQLLLTEEYLQLMAVQSVTNNTKIYFGPSISSLFLEIADLLSQNKLSKGKN